MTTTSQAVLRKAPVVAAHFGSTYGYKFEGDTVTLQASIELVHYLAHEVRWFVQLQAIPANSTSSAAAPRLVLAEIALPALAELTGTGGVFAQTTLATPPAGQGEYNLTLVLISQQAGQPGEVHDVAFFSRPETFVQPRLAAPFKCTFGKDEVLLNIARVENPRDSDNLSGTLSLELWALKAPYTGGAFQGQPLAGVILGSLAGQQSWTDMSYTLHYASPGVGTWNVALMLREWTGAGYTTRDFLNLGEPLVVKSSQPAAPAPAKAEPTVTPTKVAVAEPKPVETKAKAPETMVSAPSKKRSSKSSRK